MHVDREKQKIRKVVNEFIHDHPDIIQIIIDFIDLNPKLGVVVPDMLRCYLRLVQCFDSGHSLFICGNGGSFADSMHMTAELVKSFVRKRPLTEIQKLRFDALPHGEEIRHALEGGFRVMTLGLNHSLFTALDNDSPTRYIQFSQELYALAKEEDVLLGISTSGNAKNVIYAMVTAKAMGMTSIGLTGQSGGELVKLADIAIRVPEDKTNKIQELHLPVYHTICKIIEAHFF